MGSPPPELRPWPADHIERWALDRIKPYPGNARLHSDEQVAQIAASMQRFGVTAPVLVDEEGVLIYGHGRRAGAELLGYVDLPVAVARGWSEDEKRAYRLADNQLTLAGEWDMPLLRAEVGHLSQAGFDMPLLGFSGDEMGELLAAEGDGTGDELRDRELSASEQQLLDDAWRKLLPEWEAMVEAARSAPIIDWTKGALAVYFVRARLFGYDIPRTATMPYTPHRLYQAGTHGVLYNGLFKKAISNPPTLHSVQWASENVPVLRNLLNKTLGIHDHRYPVDFPALLARDLINEFCPAGGSVLDPCSGWGGRMLGFLLSHAAKYQGFDVDERSTAGVEQMFRDLLPFAEPKAAALIVRPFESAAEMAPDYIPLAPESFDFALTSPPYYDVEQYDGPLQSWRRYASFEQWIEGFYRPLLANACMALRPGGAFALQIGNQSYPLERTAIAVALPELRYVETRASGMINHYSGTDEADGEVIMIFRKQGDKPAAANGAADPALRYGRVL